MNLLIFGPQGSGKGTLAAAFSKMNLQTADGKSLHNVPVVVFGDLLREEAKKSTPLGAKIKTIMNTGALIPDEDAIALLKKRLSQGDVEERGFILDGFPRSLSQVTLLESSGIHVDAAVLLDVQKEVLLSRLSTRRTCSKCGAVYNTVILKPKVEGICDVDGGALIIRADETPEAIEKRLEIFETKTKPVIKYYQDKHLLHTVSITNPNATPEENAMRIVKELHLKASGV